MKISIITAFYNAEEFLPDAIESILNQTYSNWELILINDGSLDESKSIALSYKDSRIKYFEQENGGVAVARNVGLANMSGDLFCFVDADDALPVHSLACRIDLFRKNPDLAFVDGKVERRNSKLLSTESNWKPTFSGCPLNELVRLSGSCFFGPSWMIKRNAAKQYRFKDGLTHCEDLLFYMELARDGGQYSYTEKTILYYRDTPGSAMKNLKGLERGYRFIELQVKQWEEVSKLHFYTFRLRYRKAMALAYLKRGKLYDGLKVWL